MERMNKTQRSVLLVATLTSFLGPFLISSVNIALPAIEQDLGMNAVSLSWVMMAFLLSSAIFLLPAGRWADLKGAKRVFKQGTLVFTLFTLVCALADQTGFFIVARFLQGAGAAMLMTTGPVILVKEFPIHQRGFVLGISVSAVYAGLSAGPFLGGLLTDWFDWKSVFWFSGVVGLLVMLVAYLFLGSDQETDSRVSMDFGSSLIYAISLAFLVFGSSRLTSRMGWILMVSGLFLGIFFLWYQRGKGNALFPVDLFASNRLFAFSNLAALINYSATFALVFLLSLFLQKIQHYSAAEAGTILIAQPLVMALLSPLAGRLSDRIEPRLLATVGMAMCTLGLAGFSILNAGSSLFFIVGNLSFIGIGFALFSSPNMNTIMSSLDRSKSGLAGGMAATMRVLGQMMSMTIATALFAFYFGKESIEQVASVTFIRGVRIGFLIFAAICSTGIYFSWQRGRLRPAK
jgi:EmrB/QacA subfamily drug resistance transporter